ncbi:RTC4-like domain-containing protein [Phaeosphaeriaceae sp. PMI808]|nr:RTC4-like domain-containing protein [Phaeosphaeriaceae sp. PMI808]
MPQLPRNSRRLLNIVAGKRHASDDDHDEPDVKRKRSPVSKKPQPTKDIFAEPESSDDEIRAPPPRISKPSPILALYSLDEPDDLRQPQARSAKKQPEKQSKSRDLVKKGQANKGTQDLDDDGKNGMIVSSSDPFTWGLEHSSQQANKSVGAKKFSSKRKTSNIHAQQYGKKSGINHIRVPKKYKKLAKKGEYDKATENDDEDDHSEVSMLSPEELVDILDLDVQPDPDAKTTTAKNEKFPRRETLRSQPTILHDQLGSWLQDQGPASSQPGSSTPRKALDNLNEYIEQLPQEEEEGSTCPICKTAVEKSEYWDFWNGKDNTVKNQNTFCRTHQTKSAWQEYQREGYPTINWTTLPSRIRKHRMSLFKILTNDQPSDYRDRYAPIALTGKAAAVPRQRKDLPTHIQAELDSYALDDQSTYPGYYGPHGRRIITESVMKLLKNEIKKCSDPVVQGSGPATFVQAVLVPEAAILLIMEDCGVDWEGAEGIRERTCGMGMLIYEEVDDRVEVQEHEHSDDENEYGGP